MAADGATLAAELAAHVDAEARMAAALVELERHPGHLALAAGTCTGVTAERWAAASAALAGAVGGLRDLPQRARRRPRPARRARPPAARGDRRGAGETLTLDALAARMDTALREVTRVVDGRATPPTGRSSPRWCRSPTGSAQRAGGGPRARPGRRRHRAARGRAGRRRAGARPRPAGARRPSGRGRARARSPTRSGPWLARCAELAAVRDGWTAGARRTGDGARRGRGACTPRPTRPDGEAQELIADADPPASRPTAGAAGAARGAAPDSGLARPGRGGAGSAGRRRGDDGGAAHAPPTRPSGLVDRRGELRGRFDAYRAKAARLGVVERPDVLAAGDRVHDLLWTRPCDLAAATVAVVEYQRLVRDGG